MHRSITNLRSRYGEETRAVRPVLFLKPFSNKQFVESGGAQLLIPLHANIESDESVQHCAVLSFNEVLR